MQEVNNANIKKNKLGFIFGPLCMHVLHYLLIKEKQ